MLVSDAFEYTLCDGQEWVLILVLVDVGLGLGYDILVPENWMS